MFYVKRLLCIYFILLWTFCALSVSAQNGKKVIANAADLPEFSYAVPENFGDLLTSDAVYQPFAAQVRADAETILREYDVQDKTELRRLKTILAYLDFEENKLDAARERIKQVRELETPAEKFRNGDLIVMEAMLKAFDVSGEKSGAKFQMAFRRIFNESVNALPDDLRAGVGGERDFFDDLKTDFLVSGLTANLAGLVKENSKITRKEISQIVTSPFAIKFTIPLKDDIRQTYQSFLNSRKPVNIWENREVVLTNKQKLTPVLIGVWDSGVDSKVFPNQMFVNKREKLNGKDDDGNGFVDDIHGIAFNSEMKYTTDETSPLDAANVNEYPEFVREANLDADISDGIETAQTLAYQAKMTALRADEKASETYRLRWDLIRKQFMHGTQVASVIAKGNPAARLVNARVTFRDATGNHPLPTEELLRRTADAYKQTIAYFKSRKVRVVNMSWQDNPQDFVDVLKFYKIGASDDERKQTARKLFTIERDALFKAMKNAPDILFVVNAGNAAADVEATETIPAGFDLPNVLTVGAVDANGAKAAFTNTGKTVTIYGFGVNVPMLAPKGLAVRADGTSFAAPQVAGLAAKLLALNPKLSVAETVRLIRQGADTRADEKVKLINPKKSVELLLAR